MTDPISNKAGIVPKTTVGTGELKINNSPGSTEGENKISNPISSSVQGIETGNESILFAASAPPAPATNNVVKDSSILQAQNQRPHYAEMRSANFSDENSKIVKNIKQSAIDKYEKKLTEIILRLQGQLSTEKDLTFDNLKTNQKKMFDNLKSKEKEAFKKMEHDNKKLGISVLSTVIISVIFIPIAVL